MYKKKFFIVFEGIEGSGKSSHSLSLIKKLKSLKIPCVYLREPGGSKNAEYIRSFLLKNEKFLSLDTWLGKKEKVDIYVNEDVYITVPKRKKKSISAYIQYNGPIPAPIERNVKLGVLNIFINDELFSQHDVFSMEKINKVNIFSRLIRSFNFFVWGDV